ncbi:tubulin monoglycylase TTLL3 isoform X1 [Hemitrygon akajei]|uniref:tubulin monoglycylase TTLL3 isoform X1 n=1 Tax=Hemitrygon akajei TaxID=2704970 RepID=UPI003BF9DD4F
MAGGSCPKDNASEKQDESIQSLERNSLKQNFKSQCNEAKKTNKSSESWMTKEVKLYKSQGIAPEINCNRVKNCKLLVEKAIKLKKIFTIFGPYPVIRQCLRNRGWLEKRMPKPPQSLQKKEKITFMENDVDDGVGDSDGCDSDDKTGDEKDLSDDPDNIHDIVSRLLKNEMPCFLWTNGVDGYNLQKDQIFNHFSGAGSFTTKAGLCVNLRNFQWFSGVNPDSFFPRCYRIAVEEEKQSFIEDFRLTAARSILKWVVQLKKANHCLQKDQENREVSSAKEAFQRQTHNKGGVVSVKLIETALRACEEYLNTMDHKDIDVSLDTPPAVTEKCWEETIRQYYQVIHEGATIQNWNIYAALCENMLQQLQKVNAQLQIEGMRNIWIVKPGAQSRGRGITCMDRLEQIMKLVYGQPTFIADGKWVVQKYIEHPLLIYGTKFDMRQWFLVTDWNPVTIWFYKDCYLRFSTQAFSLENLDTSIHLCNNSIQKHYVASSSRHPLVPKDNIWSSNQFKEYLNQCGFTNTWEDIISPGMKKAIINTMQIMQDIVKPRKNSFELYGADFLLGEDFNPWLIEINCSPTMSPSTPVTAALCSSVQEDTIKVVIDRKLEKTCGTGQFELLYKQNTTNIPLYLGINLLVEGSGIKKPPVFTQSSGIHNNFQVSQALQKPNTAKAQIGQNSMNYDGASSASTGNVKNKDDSKVVINPSKTKCSLTDRKHEFSDHPIAPNDSMNARNSFILFNSGNGKNSINPNRNNIAKVPLKLTHSCDVKYPNNSNSANHCIIPQNPNDTKNLSPKNSSVAKHTSIFVNSDNAEDNLNTNSSNTKDTINVTSSSITNDELNSKNYTAANSSANTNTSRIAGKASNSTDNADTDSQLQAINPSITNNSPFPTQTSKTKYLSNSNNSSHAGNIAPKHINSKMSNTSQDSNNILQDCSRPNHNSKGKTHNNSKHNGKTRNLHVSKHFCKTRNNVTYNKMATVLSNYSVLSSSGAKAWDDLEEVRNNIVDATQGGKTENITKLHFGDKVDQQYEMPKLSKTGRNRGTEKHHLPTKTTFSQVSTSVNHPLFPGQQLLRNPLQVKLKYLSLDLLDLKDKKHSRASTTVDANKIRALHEKSIPLRYSYNTSRSQSEDTNIPQLHITGLQTQFKVSSDNSKKYIETQQNATINLMNRHLLTSYFPLFQ